MINNPLNKTEIKNVITNLISYFKSQKKWILIAEYLTVIDTEHEMNDDLTTYDEIMILVFYRRRTDLMKTIIIPSNEISKLDIILVTNTLHMMYLTSNNTVKFISTSDDDANITVSIYAR